MSSPDTELTCSEAPHDPRQAWTGPSESIAFDPEGIRSCLRRIDLPCFAVRRQGRIGLTDQGRLCPADTAPEDALEALASVPPVPISRLGDPAFRTAHNVAAAYTAGAMANGIASEDHVIAMGQAGFLSSFGAAGLMPDRIEAAIRRIQATMPRGPYAFNLIHSPSEEALERAGVDLYLRYGVATVEASAYLDLTPHIVRYRAAGLELDGDNRVVIRNKVIAKLSRREIAEKFLNPAPAKILAELVAQGRITERQAALAGQVPVADDITVEADSGGHTDNRPLVCLLPSILALRDDIQARRRFPVPVRVGAAGGIGTPEASLAAFAMGAAYVSTGSINQACAEAGASHHTKRLLAQAGMADVTMAPAADMFEMGVRVQVLKRGTLFPMRAQRLYELYRTCDAIEAIPDAERKKLEAQVFRKSLDEVWKETLTFFSQRDPDQIARAADNPKRKMALIFRWYLGLSSRWSNTGEPGRETDYQIWCGPAMGAFNDWVRGTYLEDPDNRRAADVARQIMTGAAVLHRVHSLRMQGLRLPDACARYIPEEQA